MGVRSLDCRAERRGPESNRYLHVACMASASGRRPGARVQNCTEATRVQAGSSTLELRGQSRRASGCGSPPRPRAAVVQSTRHCRRRVSDRPAGGPAQERIGDAARCEHAAGLRRVSRPSEEAIVFAFKSERLVQLGYGPVESGRSDSNRQSLVACRAYSSGRSLVTWCFVQSEQAAGCSIMRECLTIRLRPEAVGFEPTCLACRVCSS